MKPAAKRVLKPKPPLEKEIQKQIVRFLNLRGWWVYSTSQGYRKERGGTRTTPGLPDLFAMGYQRSLWIEVKRPGGKVRAAQAQFAQLCNRYEIPHLIAYSLQDVIDYLSPSQDQP